MEVLITRLTPYREKDYIVSAISATGSISFRASGALALKSKFAGKLFLYALLDVELRETKAGYTLASIESLNNMAKIFTDYKRIITLNVIGEIINRTLKDEDSIIEVFPLIKVAMLGLPKASHLPSLTYLFITNLLRILGLGLVIDKCVVCGLKTNIIGVDFYKGGLVCGNCQNNETIKLSEHEIKVVRYGFMINEEQLFRHELNDDEVNRLLKLMLKHLEETYNFKIISSELIS